MTRTYTITCAAGTIRLDGQTRGECAFTVTNTSAAVVRAHPTVIALDGRARNWFAVVGEPVRELAPGQTVQISVTILPSDASPGRYFFRLDVLPAEGGERISGPEACVELTSAAAPLPAGSKPFPWLWLVLALVLVATIAVVSWMMWRSAGEASRASLNDALEQPDQPVQSVSPVVAGETTQAIRELAVAVSDGHRADEAATIFKFYGALLEQGRVSATRLPTIITTKTAKPVMARVKDVGTKVPREAKDLDLVDDDHAVGVTLEEFGLTLLFFIRQGSPSKVSGVVG